MTTLTSGIVVHSWSPATQARATIVLQHGFGEYAERYIDEHSAFIPHLLAQGYQVWAQDMWGHGRSPGRRGGVHVGRAVEDHLAVRALAAKAQQPVVLLGHSLGGLVTATSAAVDPRGVAGVILLSPSLPSEVPAPVRWALGLAARVRPGTRLPMPRRPFSELSRDQTVGARAAQDDILFDGQISVLVAATALASMGQLRAAADRWAHPTLMAHGTADTYTDPADSAAFVDSLPAGDVTLHLVPEAYHELLSDPLASHARSLIDSWAAQRIGPFMHG